MAIKPNDDYKNCWTYPKEALDDMFDQVEKQIDDAETGIEAQRDQAIAAIQEQGAETLASIPEDYSDLVAEVSSVKGDLQLKANIDGYYESMTVGNAEQLVSSVYVEDSVPYLFRTSGGSADIGDREYDKIVGASVVWNQTLAKHTGYGVVTGDTTGLTISVDSNGYVNVSGTASDTCVIALSPAPLVNVPANHVWLMLCDGFTDFYWGRIGFAPTARQFFINKHTSAFSGSAIIRLISGTAYDIHARFCGFDLTYMFGSTIADYIYTLESSTAGTGIAKLRASGFFTKPWYAYSLNTIKSVEGLTSHDMVMFNQWDEQWELGYYNNNDGTKLNSQNCIRSKNAINVLPNTQYYIKTPAKVSLRFYDIDGNYISGSGASTYTVTTFTTPANCYQLRFYLNDSYGTTYKNDICINLHWDGERDGEYEPYKKYSYPLDDSLTLRGIPKLDANNQLYYDGDTYESDGTVTRRYGVVDLGTLNWTYSSGSSRFSATLSSMSGAVREIPMICEKYVALCNGEDYPQEGVSCIYGGGSIIYVHDATYNDATAFKSAMSGVYLVYKLATPTTESADAFQSPQIVDDFGTEEYVIDSQADVLCPVGHETRYSPNLRAKLEMAPDSPTDGDGDYLLRQTNGINTYVPFVKELPTLSGEDGNYVLKATKSGSTVTLSWEAQS